MKCLYCNKELENINIPHCPHCKKVGFWFQTPDVCQICRKTFQDLVVHHVDGNHHNDLFSNKIKICTRCHGNIHWGFTLKRPGRKSKKFNEQNPLNLDYITFLLITAYRNRVLESDNTGFEKNQIYL